MLVVRERVVVLVWMGPGDSKGAKQSANAVGLKSLGFLILGSYYVCKQKNIALVGCGDQR